MSTFRQFVCLLLGLGCIPTGGLLRAQVAESAAGPSETKLASTTGPENSQDIQRLIESLGNASFDVRERSSSALLEIGPAAIDSLQSFLDRPSSRQSSEARRRAKLLVSEIKSQYFEVASKGFLVDPDGDASHGLPAWPLFRDIVGCSRSSKLLFLEMLKSNYELAQRMEALHQAQGEGDDVSDLLVMHTQSTNEQAAALLTKIFRGAGISIGDSVAMLLAVSMMESTVPVETSDVIYLSAQRGFSEYLAKPGFRQCLEKFLSEWVPKSHDGLAPDLIGMAFSLNLPTVLPIARRHLSPAFDKNTRELAIYCVAKFGDRSDVPELLKLAHDTTTIHEFDDSRHGIIVLRAVPPGLRDKEPSDIQGASKLVRVNDVAVAAAMILLGEDPSQIFPRCSKEVFFRRELSALAVEQNEAEQRTNLIRTWVAEHLDESLDE